MQIYWKKYKYLILLIIIGLILNYLYAVVTTATNAPFRYDDSITFLGQFMEAYLGQPFASKFDYFFMPAIYPHPKITLRIVTIACYHLFGEINFELLRYFTAFFVILFGVCIWHYSNVKKRILLFLPFAALLLIPNITNTWVVILGNTITSILIILTVVNLIKGRVLLSCLFAFLLTFNGPTGMFIFPIGLMVLFLVGNSESEKNKWTKYLIWIGFGIFAVWLFVTKVFKAEMPDGRNDGSLMVDNFQDLIGVIQMFFDTAFMTLKNAFGIPSIVLALLGIPLILFAAFKTYKEVGKGNYTLLIPFSVAIYYLALVGIISLYSYDSDLDNQTVYTRYECYSNYIMALLGFILTYTTKAYTVVDYVKIGAMILIAFAAQVQGFSTYFDFNGQRIVSAFGRRINVGIRTESMVKKSLETNDINYNIVRKFLVEDTYDLGKDLSWIKDYKNYRELLIYREAIDKGVYKNEKLYNSRGFIEEHIMFDSY